MLHLPAVGYLGALPVRNIVTYYLEPAEVWLDGPR